MQVADLNPLNCCWQNHPFVNSAEGCHAQLSGLLTLSQGWALACAVECGHTTRYLWPQLCCSWYSLPYWDQLSLPAWQAQGAAVVWGLMESTRASSERWEKPLAHCSDLAVPPVSVSSSSPLPCLYTRVFTCCFNASGVLPPWSTPSLHWQVRQRDSMVFLPNHLHILRRQTLLLLKPSGFNTALWKYY